MALRIGAKLPIQQAIDTCELHHVTNPMPLSARLRDLVNTVRVNEDALSRFLAIELRVTCSTDFASLLSVLVVEFPAAFGLERVILWLNESAAVVRDVLDPETAAGLDRRHLRTGRLNDLRVDGLCDGDRPWLGSSDLLSHALKTALFANDAVPASVALLPLAGEGGPDGYLCLGSNDPARFFDGLGTELLERFVKFVSAGLDNVAHREQLRQLGMTDALTGLPNRRYFDARLREEIQRTARSGSPIAALFIDIDLFKGINDAYGHPAGDRALSAVASCIRRTVRLGDTVARYGGEEFIALVHGNASDALIIAERVRFAVESLDLQDKQRRLPLTVSVGVAATSQSAGAIDTDAAMQSLLDAADRSMYRAKRNGRNRVEIDRVHEEATTATAPATGTPALG